MASRARSNLNAGTGGSQRRDGFFYANALTKLFEYIAQIVDGHGNLVERHYGEGRMVKVIERLQVEADVQGGLIIETWSDERNVDHIPGSFISAGTVVKGHDLTNQFSRGCRAEW